jgi:diacylglycerol kinase family enzyme
VTVDVILNPHARGLREGHPCRRAIADEAARGEARVHETHDFDALEAVARGIAARGTSAVVLAGGDGSMMRGLGALARAFGEAPLPPVGFAAAGTVGTVARNLGLLGLSGARVVRAACEGTAGTDRQPTLRARCEPAGDHVGFIFGTGLVAHFFEVYLRARQPGLWTAAKIAGRVFAGSFVGAPLAREVLAPTACSITVDGSQHSARAWSLVVASVVRDVGLHFLLTYRAGEAEEQFHVVASGLPAHALGPQMPRVLAGAPLVGEPRVDALARSLRVDFEGQEGSFVLDGEVLGAQNVVIEPGPVIDLLRP